MPFLPLYPEEGIPARDGQFDFVLVTGDAYVDHPSFGTAIISRVLEDEGYSVGIIAQPDYRSCEDFRGFGRPRLAFLVNSGNIDSMVAHYTVAKKKRNDDYYSPGGKAGYRPDRALIVYCNRIREAYGDVPVLIGGIEASTRRFAHYDYWTDSVRRSVLVDSGADMLMYGMGENIVRRIAFLLNRGIPVRKIRDVRGTAFMENTDFRPHFPSVFTGEFELIRKDPQAYVSAFRLQSENQDSHYGKALVEGYGNRILVQNPPMPPLTTEELDAVYALPYMRTYHPVYEKDGGIPAIKEVKFSITHNRGCFGNCNFCSIAFHQGRTVTSRSIASCVREAELLTRLPDFKGYIHDVGGPSANFRTNGCTKAETNGVCPNRNCLTPKICPNMKVSHEEYLRLLEAIEQVNGVKKVFVRSGLRYDYMLADKDDRFFRKIVSDHISGQLKVAPEHCCDEVLTQMGKPSVETYDRFKDKFYAITEELGKEQYLIPYLMSSHPGSTVKDAIELAVYLKENRINPEQVQDFYPTPGTASTCMFWTGINPFTGEKVYVPRSYEEKRIQRALLQWYRPENHDRIRNALRAAGRADLIGFGPHCLVPPREIRKQTAGKHGPKNGKPERKAGGRTNGRRTDARKNAPGTQKKKTGR